MREFVQGELEKARLSKCDCEYPDNVQACFCVSSSLRTGMRVLRVGRCGRLNDMKRFLLCVESELLASGGAFFFDREAPDCCERIFCGIPGCCTGSRGLGALWQLPQPRTCPGRIPVLLHLSRSGACVNLERASCWLGRDVHAVPTQAPQNHKSFPFKVPFTTRMHSLLPHWEPGPLCKKKKMEGKTRIGY